MISPVRVRYAPSPTGLPHVGNIRTAFFNWLLARHTCGQFIVRIEDTDVARTVPGATEGILEGLKWLGIDWDEGPNNGGDFGPYFQSQRLDIYQKMAQQLISQGQAYYCHCSSQRLEQMRAAQIADKKPTGYDRHCRDAELDYTKGAVIRFKMPLDGSTSFNDSIRGKVTFENANLDDFVLLKSDGYPTYHLANIVDDNLMRISHVLRAEEWLSSTPKHILLYAAFGYPAPVFAHLPIILGSDRSKLSKRHGAVSILDYKEQGYLPETMINFLALLGWALDDKSEIFSREELIQNFSLERISQTSAIFNKEKLDWMNGVYIRKLPLPEFARLSLPFLENGLPSNVKRPLNTNYVEKVLPLVQERVKTLSETATAEISGFFFGENIEYDTSLLIDKKIGYQKTLDILQIARAKLDELETFEAPALELLLRNLIEEIGVKAGQLFGTLRTAVTGLTATPPLFQTMEVLGKNISLRRIDEAISKLGNYLPTEL
ncbi:MAG: glutamate--tRNA ligase [Dehalococcoidia bacterium]|nr:glutamate--tRNA ligase [Dehalococcoidia bacterium]